MSQRFFKTHLLLLEKNKVFNRPRWPDFAILFIHLLVKITWHSIKITFSAKEVHAMIYTASPKE